MTCPRCQSTVDADSRFCKHCGATIQAYSQKITVASPAARPDAVDSRPPPSAEAYRNPLLEKPVWEGRAAHRAFAGSWILWLIAVILLLYFVIARSPQDGVFRKVLWWIIAGAAAALAVRQFLLVFGQRYRLTTQRLFVDRGVLTRVTDQMELIRVDDVRIRQNILDRVLNTGDVEVFASDDSDESVVLESIDRPAEVAEALRVHVRSARGKQTLFVESV